MLFLVKSDRTSDILFSSSVKSMLYILAQRCGDCGNTIVLFQYESMRSGISFEGDFPAQISQTFQVGHRYSPR